MLREMGLWERRGLLAAVFLLCLISALINIAFSDHLRTETIATRAYWLIGGTLIVPLLVLLGLKVQEHMPRTFGFFERQWKRNGLWLVLLLGVIGGLAAIWFLGAFSGETIRHSDYVYHHYRSTYMAEELIPEHAALTGWNPYFFGGYPMIFYPVVQSAIPALLNVVSGNLLSISLLTYALIFFAYAIQPFPIYMLANRMGVSRREALLVAAAAVGLSLAFTVMLYGGIGTALALPLSALSIYYLIGYLNNGKLRELAACGLSLIHI